MASKKQRQEAQDMLMHGIGNVLGYWQEQYAAQSMTDEERKEMTQILQEQADRVAKMFGYDKAWSN